MAQRNGGGYQPGPLQNLSSDWDNNRQSDTSSLGWPEGTTLVITQLPLPFGRYHAEK
jgi:hypothetical protein